MIRIQNFLKKLSESILALIKVILLSKFWSNFKFEVKNRDLVLLGNGPSLQSFLKEKSDFLKNKELFCVNFFPITSQYEEFQPAYFIVSAPELWLEDVDSIYHEKSDQLFNAINEKTSWPLKLLIPHEARKTKRWRTIISQNKKIEVIFFNNIGIEGFRNFTFWCFKNKLAMPRPHNIVIPSLITAINLGYKKIYLWGVENNQFKELSVNEDNIALINQRHFYDFNKTKPSTMNKLGKGKRMVHEILHKFELSFAAYHVIDDYARYRGVQIINQTPDSLIDAFDREVLD